MDRGEALSGERVQGLCPGKWLFGWGSTTCLHITSSEALRSEANWHLKAARLLGFSVLHCLISGAPPRSLYC